MEACPICLENFQVGDKARGNKDNTWWLVMVVTGVCGKWHAFMPCCECERLLQRKYHMTNLISLDQELLCHSRIWCYRNGSFLLEAWDANIIKYQWNHLFSLGSAFPEVRRLPCMHVFHVVGLQLGDWESWRWSIVLNVSKLYAPMLNIQCCKCKFKPFAIYIHLLCAYSADSWHLRPYRSWIF